MRWHRRHSSRSRRSSRAGARGSMASLPGKVEGGEKGLGDGRPAKGQGAFPGIAPQSRPSGGLLAEHHGGLCKPPVVADGQREAVVVVVDQLGPAAWRKATDARPLAMASSRTFPQVSESDGKRKRSALA